MQINQVTAKTLHLDKTDMRSEAERNESRQRAIRLVHLHLQQTCRMPYLAVEQAAHVTEGSTDLYNRLKARDPVDAIYCTTLVALQNAVMASFAEAALSRGRDENLARAYEGVTLLIEAVAVRENRRALIADTERREDVLSQLMLRYISVPPKAE
jgi:hypothetical protein